MPIINATPSRGLAALLALSLPLAAQAISLTETFENPTAPGWNLSGSATLTGTTGTPGWLQLTPATNNKAGTAIYNTPFSNAEGVQVTFDYSVFGGTGADGFSFYLIDGAEPNPVPGFSGGALGYTGDASHAGVKLGYVGIGFDVYGAFSSTAVGACAVPCTFRPNAVAVRGYGSGLDMAHFSLLASVNPAMGVTTPNINSPKTARITITKVTMADPTPSITVEMRDYGSTSWVKVIDALSLAGNGPVPATFKMGFSASTGGLNNNHMIRGTKVTNADGSTLDMDLSGLPATAYAGEPYSGTFTCTNLYSTTLPNGACGVTGLPTGLTVTPNSCTIGPGNTAWSAGDDVPASGTVTCSVGGTPGTAGTTPAQGSFSLGTDVANRTRQLSILAAPQMSMDMAGLPRPRQGQPYSGTYSCSNAAAAGDLVADPANVCTVPALAGLPGMSPVQCAIGAMPWNPGDAIPAGATVACTLTGTPTALPAGPVTGQAGMPGGTPGATSAGAALAPAPAGVASVPALSPWGLSVLAALLGALGLRRRRQAA